MAIEITEGVFVIMMAAESVDAFCGGESRLVIFVPYRLETVRITATGCCQNIYVTIGINIDQIKEIDAVGIRADQFWPELLVAIAAKKI